MSWNDTMNRGSFLVGIGYFWRGLKLLGHPRLRLFVIIPLLINILIFAVLTVALAQQFNAFVATLTDWLPSWLTFLAWLLTLFAALLIILIYGYFFSLITTFIAAPFYGILAEQVETLVTGKNLEGEVLWRMVPRVLVREVIKLWYFLWRSVIVFFLTFIPVFGQVIGFSWSAWSMSVQYSDYAADNHQIPFSHCRRKLNGKLWTSLGFGAPVTIGMMIPLVNILVPTAAVIGGTLIWLEVEASKASRPHNPGF